MPLPLLVEGASLDKEIFFLRDYKKDWKDDIMSGKNKDNEAERALKKYDKLACPWQNGITIHLFQWKKLNSGPLLVDIS